MRGMSRRYNTENAFRSFVRSLMSLVFLKPEDIAPTFYILCSSTVDADLKNICDYFERTWVQGYGVDLICQYDEMFRTNNNAEAFHGGIRSMFSRPRPLFFDFVEKLTGVMDRAEHEFNVERVNPK